MLNLLRKNTKRIFLIILFMIVPPFCFFGLDMAFRSLSGATFAGKVFGKSVSIDRFSIYQKETRTQMTAQLALFYGIQNFDQLSALRSQLGEMLTQQNVNQLTWERILLTKLADRYEIPTSDGEVAAWLARFPLFQDKGRFDPQRYTLVLRNAFGVSSVTFEKELKTTLKIDRLRRFVTEGVPIADEEIRAAFQEAEEKARILCVKFDAAQFAGEVKLSEANLRSHYESRREAFRVPEKIRCRVVILKNGKASPEALFEKATDLSLELLKNPDSAAVAKEYGAEYKETPLFARDEKSLPAEVVERAFMLDLGDYSTPIQTAETVYFVSPLEKKESQIPAFEACKKEVESALRLERARKLAQEKAESKRQELDPLMQKEKIGFAEAAKKLGLQVEKPAPFTRRESPPRDVVPQAMQQLAFTLPINQASPVVPTENGALFFGVSEKTAPEFKEEPALVEKLKNDKRMKQYQAWLSWLKREANLVDLTPFLK